MCLCILSALMPDRNFHIVICFGLRGREKETLSWINVWLISPHQKKGERLSDVRKRHPVLKITQDKCYRSGGICVCLCMCVTRSCNLSQHGVRSSESQCYCVLTSHITTSQYYYGHMHTHTDTHRLLVQVVTIVFLRERGDHA